MNDRIHLINSFRSHLGERKKSIGKRLTYLRIMQFFGLLLIILPFVNALNSLILPADPLWGMRWQDAGLITLLSLSYFFSVPKFFYESLLLTHLKRIESEASTAPEELNTKLREHIHNLNHTGKNTTLKIVVIGIFSLAAIVQVLTQGDFRYWTYFRIPFLLLVITVAVDFFRNYSRLRENIKKYEGFVEK